jgi:hypothetical protein
MKINYLKVAVIGAMAGTMMVSCGSSKQVAQAPETTSNKVKQMEEEAALLEAQANLNATKRRIKAEEERAKQIDAMEDKWEDGAVGVLTPCEDDASNKPGEWMGGFGIGEDLTDQQAARAEAKRAARVDIGQNFIGVIKNFTRDYGSKTNTSDGKQSRQADLEGAVEIATEKVLDKYSYPVCTKTTKTKRGSYKIYMAIRVPVDVYKDNMAKELDVMKVKYDKQKLFEAMDAALDKQKSSKSQVQQRNRAVQQSQWGDE